MFRKEIMLATCFFLMNINAYAADIDKIGIIDFQKILNISTKGKSIQNRIKQKGEELKSELDKAEAEIKKLQELYKKEALVLNEEEKKKRAMEVQIKINDFRKLQQKNGAEFNEFRSGLINELREDIEEYTDKKGKEEGYLLIIEKESGTVFYAHNSADMTDEVIQDCDKDKNEENSNK
jgi:outer membrane protein